MKQIMNEFILDIAFHPGETLAEKLEEMNMGPKEFAVRSGKPEKTISAILRGESSITPDMAVLFENVLQIPARFWLKRQYEYDEYIARGKRKIVIEDAISWAKKFPYQEMVELGWIQPTKNIQERVIALFNYFRISNHEAWEEYFYNQQLKVRFRISLQQSSNPYALSAWIRQGEIQASTINSEPYDKGKFHSYLSEIKKLIAQSNDETFKKLQDLCLECGVKIIYTPAVKETSISGATRWINEHPIIQLTEQNTENKQFWFTFFHEVGHIVLHGKKEVFLENVEYSDINHEKEKEADEFALELLK